MGADGSNNILCVPSGVHAGQTQKGAENSLMM